jgi:protein-S-isoprenylcysteine O-methyltransferase Ste14
VIALVVVILVYGLLVIQKEESALAEKYPGEFEMYRGKTWKLVPFIY